MYAWQRAGTETVLPAKRGKVSSILGFTRLNNDSQYYDFEGNLSSKLWVTLVDNFIVEKTDFPLKTVLVIDNATTHIPGICKLKRQE